MNDFMTIPLPLYTIDTEHHLADKETGELETLLITTRFYDEKFGWMYVFQIATETYCHTEQDLTKILEEFEI